MPAAPYRMSYLVPSSAVGTTLRFSARATDFSGNVGTAQLAFDAIGDLPPTAAVSAPAQLVAGIPATLTGLAADDTGVSFLAFHVGTQDHPPEVGRSYLRPFHVAYTPPAALVGTSV